jgi:hypothetical protein
LRECVIRLTTESTADRRPGTNAFHCIVQPACPASTVTVLRLDPEAFQLPHGVRHQPFAAGLVDGSAAPFDDDHVKPRPCSMQGGGQPRRATSDEQVDHVKLDSAAFSTLIRVLSRAALSTENTSAVIHPVCTNGSATPSATTAT